MEYNFVESLPEEFSCQICMKVLSEPQLTDCCGQHFCRACLEIWFKKQVERKKVCPHCRSENFNHMRYLPLKRKIDELKVYCSNRERGCTTVLKLCELADHLSLQSVHGCGFTPIACPNKCGISGILRKDLENHCQKSCPKRRVKCQYCEAWGPHDHINGVHVNDCEEYPLVCPRRCSGGVGIKRKDLEKHKEVCLLEPVECPFSNVGCNEELVRENLDYHLNKSANQHLLKLMSSHNSLLISHNSLLTSHNSLLLTVKGATADIKALQERVNDMDVASALKTISKKLQFPKHDLELVKEGDRLEFQFPITRRNWKSDPFYVMGYKMNFTLMHQKNHSRYVVLELMQGEHDSELEHPMNLEQDITVEVGYTQGHNSSVRQSNNKTFRSCMQCNPVTKNTLCLNRVLSLDIDSFAAFYCRNCVVTVKLLTHNH